MFNSKSKMRRGKRFKILPKPKFAFLKFLTLLVGALCYNMTAHAAYPYAKIKNNTEYTISGEVQYISFLCSDDSYTVKPGETWSASSRGVCLIDAITGSTRGAVGKNGEKTHVVSYSSTGTSYSVFQINAYSGSYRIFSEEEFADVTDTRQGKSPGFYFVNKTSWPLVYSLDQVGCLHHGIIPTGAGKGGLLKVDTGSVWFTMKIRIQPDGVNPQTDWDCVKPVAELVADVALAAASGGSSAVAQAGGKIVVKQVIKAAVKKGVKTAIKKAATKVITDMAKDELGKLLTDAGSVELYGQYAGYAWPFRCDNMPEYHITGGPEALRDETGELHLRRGVPFKVTKVNDCGNDMMTGSKKSMTSDQSSFSSWETGAISAAPASASCVDFYTGFNGNGTKLTLCEQNHNWKDYTNLGNGNNSHHYKVKSFQCGSKVGYVQFMDGNQSPMPRHNESCKGGNMVNPNAFVTGYGTGVGVYKKPHKCCGE